VSDPHETPQPAPQLRWGGVSVALLIIGLLILVPSGLCTGLFGLGVLGSFLTGNVADAMSTGGMVAVIGGIPVVIGGVLVFAAFRLRKKG
jgi:hypothetical protein